MFFNVTETDRSLERQNQSKRKRLKEKELRKCEKKIQNTMEGLKDQINKLVKDIRYLGGKLLSIFSFFFFFFFLIMH